jgi:hypothetical protein
LPVGTRINKNKSRAGAQEYPYINCLSPAEFAFFGIDEFIGIFSSEIMQKVEKKTNDQNTIILSQSLKMIANIKTCDDNKKSEITFFILRILRNIKKEMKITKKAIE